MKRRADINPAPGRQMFSRRFFHRSTLLHKLIPFKLADIGEGITEVQILQWYIKEGSSVKQFQKIAEVQSDKATVDITSRYDGVIKKIHYAVNEMAAVGEPLVDIETGDGDGKEEKERKQKESSATIPLAGRKLESTIQSSSDAPVMPSVRKLAKERGIDLSRIKGSGKDGRILMEDLATESSHASTHQSSALTYTPIQLNPVKKAMVRSMEESLSIPHFTFCDEYRLDQLLLARSQFLARTGLSKTSLLPFVLGAVSRGLQEFPAINAHYFRERKEALAVHEHNIGIAVDTPLGLMVPVLKGVQGKSIEEIAIQLQELTRKARDNALKQEDFQDATISFSNIGSIGGTYATPLIVPPQVAIGAMGRTRPQLIPSATAASGFEVAQVAAVSWSGDHRVVDGAMMAKFSGRVKELLESPLLLLLE